MNKYVVYGIHQLICEVQEGEFKKVFLVKTCEYEKIINSLIKAEYTVTFDGNNLTLIGEDITFEFKNISLSDQNVKFTDKNLLALFNDAKEKMRKQAKYGGLITLISDFKTRFKRNLGLKICSGVLVSLISGMLMTGSMQTGAVIEPNEIKDNQSEDIIPNFDTGAIVSESFSVMGESLIMNSAIFNVSQENEPKQETEVETQIKTEPTYEEVCDEYVKKYCGYFHLDSDKVLEFIHMATANYTMDFTEVIGSSYYDVDNVESAIMVLVYNMQRNMLASKLENYLIPSSSPYYDIEKAPEENVYSRNFFKNDEDIVTLSEDLRVSNGMSYSEYLGVVSDILGADKNYLLAISYLESGRVTSDIALNKNNFGGLRGKDTGYFTYPTPEAGILAFCYNLRAYSRYDFTSLEALSCRYVYGNFETPDLQWADNVESIHDEITSSPESYFLPEDEVILYSQNNNLKRELTIKY